MHKFSRKKSTVATVLTFSTILLGLALVSVSAQESDHGPQSYMVYTEFYQCDWSRHAEADAIFEAKLQPVFEDLVKDGTILGWAYLKRSFGDEWGRGITIRYENGRDFFAIRRESRSRLRQNHTEDLNDFFEVCGPHRENVYRATGRP
jgi:hypothetical protein